MSKCKDLPKKGASNAFKTNKRGPKKIWIPKDKIILMQMSLTIGKTHLSWYPNSSSSQHMTYVSMPDPYVWWNCNF